VTGPTGPTGGSVGVFGTPENNQVAVWTNADTIEGSAGFVFSGNILGVGVGVGAGRVNIRGATASPGSLLLWSGNKSFDFEYNQVAGQAYISDGDSKTIVRYYDSGRVEAYYSGNKTVTDARDMELLVNTNERCFRGIPNGNTELYWDNTLRLETIELGVGIVGKMESLTVFITDIKSGATQGGAGAAAHEVWKTASHATLPDNVLLIGV